MDCRLECLGRGQPLLTIANRRIGGVTRAIPTHISIPDVDAAAAATDSDWPRLLADARCRAWILHEEFPATLTSGLLRIACALSDVDFDLARAAAN